MEKVLFVCTANICRSPMAEAIFNTLTEDRGLSFQTMSAGTEALVGRPMASNAITALEEVGIYTKNHRARQVDEAMLVESDLALAMSPQHVAGLRRNYKNLADKIYTLPEYATGVSNGEMISDPYGYAISTYRTCVRQLLEYMERTIERLSE